MFKLLRNLATVIVVYFSCCANLGMSDENEPKFVCDEYEMRIFIDVGKSEVLFCKSSHPSNWIFNETSLEPSKFVHKRDGAEIENGEVDALWIKDVNMKFMPNGIKKKFPKLVAINFWNCGLTYFDKNNLKQFGSDLQDFRLKGSPIEVLDSDLFQFNPNLELISIWNCSLKFIDSGFFENLKNFKKLIIVQIELSECIDQIFDSRKDGKIESFKWNYENCTDTRALDKHLKLGNDFRKTQQVVDENATKV